MKYTNLLSKLYKEKIISEPSWERVKQFEKENTISLEWDLKRMLYIGVTELSGGLGILIYKNIDTIGHQAILALIALISVSGYIYCFKTSKPFSWGKIDSPNLLFDYILLLANLMMLTFIAYLQYQYNVFGDKYGLATFFPMVILFFTAYYFDHIGILSLAITNFAAWLGITITPLHLWQSNDFNSSRIIFTGIGIGILLLVVAATSRIRKLKAHFELTYNNFGTHTLFVSFLAGMGHFYNLYIIWFLVILAFASYSYFKAIRENSFYFLVVTVLYTYVAVSWVVVRLLMASNLDIGSIYLGIIYFMVSAFWLVAFLMRTNKKLKSNDSI
jgi:hypothetical protein